MKFLLKMHDKQRHLFEKGGKFERLHPLFEAQDTFLFTPAEVTHGAPHVRDALDIKRLMITVVVALIPCVLFGIWNAGYQYNTVNQTGLTSFMDHIIRGAILVMPIILTSYIVGGLWEVGFAIVRKHPINEGFLVSGLLFPLTLPPTIPLWQVAVGISFGIVIGKEVFGGTGFNVLNPALTARAFLYFAYPAQITGDKVWTATVEGGKYIEGFTGATPLGVAMVPHEHSLVETLNSMGFTLRSMITGIEPGSIGETSVIACAIGAVILIFSGVGSWRIMAGSLLGLVGASALMHALPDNGNLKPLNELPFYYHIAIGSWAFGTVFMATDPVSAAATNKGKWIYGFLIGFLIVVVRIANPAYPETTMVVILFMNVMAPMIDHYVVQAHIKQRRRRHAIA